MPTVKFFTLIFISNHFANATILKLCSCRRTLKQMTVGHIYILFDKSNHAAKLFSINGLIKVQTSPSII